MIVTEFRSTLMPGLRDDYVKEVEKLAAIAKAMPGYISHKGFFAEDGERCTIVEFENEEGMRAWTMNPDHRSAKKKARETYYASYSVQICDVKRESKFDREAKARPPNEAFCSEFHGTTDVHGRLPRKLLTASGKPARKSRNP